MTLLNKAAIAAAIATAFALAAPLASADDGTTLEVSVKDHQFQPAEFKAAAGTPDRRIEIVWLASKRSVTVRRAGESCHAAAAAIGITERHHATRRVGAFGDPMIVVAADNPNPTRRDRADNKPDGMRPHRDDAWRRSGRSAAISGERARRG